MTKHRIRGDWLINDYIDNQGRHRYLKIVVIDGIAYDDTSDFPMISPSDMRLKLDADDCLAAWGAGVAFAPDPGEIDRIGRSVFTPA
jgi:hypothetical protein